MVYGNHFAPAFSLLEAFSCLHRRRRRFCTAAPIFSCLLSRRRRWYAAAPIIRMVWVWVLSGLAAALAMALALARPSVVVDGVLRWRLLGNAAIRRRSVVCWGWGRVASFGRPAICWRWLVSGGSGAGIWLWQWCSGTGAGIGLCLLIRGGVWRRLVAYCHQWRRR